MKMKSTFQLFGLLGLITFASLTNAGDADTTAISSINSSGNQIFSPIKSILTISCRLYCITIPGKPQRCFYDPSIPKCAMLNQ